MIALEAAHWRMWRALRLRALEQAPEAFVSTLEGTLARDEADGEDYWRGYFRRPGPTLVAELDGVPVGMARLVHEDDAPFADIFSVWVAPEARGQGVGRTLVTGCLEWSDEHRPGIPVRLAVVEANPAARRLYERCGFVVTGRNPEDDAELLMERRTDLAGRRDHAPGSVDFRP